MRLLTTLFTLTLATVAAAQAGWATYQGFTNNETLYVQPALSDPVLHRQVAWIDSPTQLGDTLLGYALEWYSTPQRTIITCEQWDFDGVMGGSLVFAVTTFNAALDPTDFIDKATIDALSSHTPGGQAWAKSLISGACNSDEIAKAKSGGGFYKTKTLYVPLAADQSDNAVLTRPWASGTLGLHFERTTNALTVTSQ